MICQKYNPHAPVHIHRVVLERDRNNLNALAKYPVIASHTVPRMAHSPAVIYSSVELSHVPLRRWSLMTRFLITPS